MGAQELINGYQRYCLYLKECPPTELRKMPYVMECVENVRKMRLASKAPSTQKWADFPTRFKQDNATNSNILIIPRVTSENRKYLPIGYYEYPTVCSDSAFQVIEADYYLFGILNSSMHMAWLKTVCGRLKGDYRYSNTLVYNNFVFPNTNEKQKTDIAKKAKNILDVREKYPNNTLADLYDYLATPPDLLKAHRELDKAVEKAYGQTFKTDEERMEFLFEKYQQTY